MRVMAVKVAVVVVEVVVVVVVMVVMAVAEGAAGKRDEPGMFFLTPYCGCQPRWYAFRVSACISYTALLACKNRL